MQTQPEYPDPISPSGDAGRRARFGMMTVGYAAMNGTVDIPAADLAAAAIFREFGADHPLTMEFERFIDRLTKDGTGLDVLAEAGSSLVAAVRRSTWPNASGRADLDG